MHIWIDIDNAKHVCFFKSLIAELNNRGHQVTVTAQDEKEVKEAFKKYQIEVKIIGKIFSVFGLFEKFFQMYRTALLKKYVFLRDVNLAFSLGSRSMLTTCAYLELPLVILLYHPMQKIHIYHFGYKKSYYIISDAISEELITNYCISSKRIRNYKGVGDNEVPNSIYQDLVEICNHLDSLSNCINKEVDA